MTSHDTGQLGTRDLPTAHPDAGPATDEQERPFAQPSDTAAAPRDDIPAGGSPSSEDALLDADVSARLRRQWEGVQTRFVDAPRDAVEEADELVVSVMRLLADGFAEERERLEAQWGTGGDASTEDLRVALQRYRSFFQRLLAT